MKVRANKENSDYYKTCPICNNLFNNRKKWKNSWDTVIYCSKRCKNEKQKHIQRAQQ
ncbi:MAG: DUF2256 domain-containing protein [Parvicellaceae bacterium]